MLPRDAHPKQIGVTERPVCPNARFSILRSMEHTIRLRVRHHEMDALGHVNNAVYLHYVEEAAIEHARARGYDEARWRELGGTWVVRRHEIEYRAPAVAGDELFVTTRVLALDRARGTRRTTIERD